MEEEVQTILIFLNGMKVFPILESLFMSKFITFILTFKRVDHFCQPPQLHIYLRFGLSHPFRVFGFSLSRCLRFRLVNLVYATRHSKSITKDLYSTHILSSVVATKLKSVTPKLVGLNPFDPPPALISLAAETI